MTNLANFQPLNVATNSRKRGGGKKGSLTMINSKNGKRLEFSNELIETLDINDNTVQIGFSDTAVIFGTNLPGTDNRFVFRGSENQKIVYCTAAVEEITRVQDIHFDGKTSFTWYKPIVDEYEGRPIVMFEREEGDSDE